MYIRCRANAASSHRRDIIVGRLRAVQLIYTTTKKNKTSVFLCMLCMRSYMPVSIWICDNYVIFNIWARMKSKICRINTLCKNRFSGSQPVCRWTKNNTFTRIFIANCLIFRRRFVALHFVGLYICIILWAVSNKFIHQYYSMNMNELIEVLSISVW